MGNCLDAEVGTGMGIVISSSRRSLSHDWALEHRLVEFYVSYIFQSLIARKAQLLKPASGLRGGHVSLGS
jgi:hypothetical protein